MTEAQLLETDQELEASMHAERRMVAGASVIGLLAGGIAILFGPACAAVAIISMTVAALFGFGQKIIF